jgi:thiol-disulfide isomerase/thioredoxin
MQGCPACEEYKPRIQRIYRELQQQGYCMPQMEFLDANAQPNQVAANHYAVKFTPTTVIQKSSGRWRKWETSLSDNEIRYVLMIASRGAHCDI